MISAHSWYRSAFLSNRALRSRSGRLPVPPRGNGAVVFGPLYLFGGLHAGPGVRLVHRNLLVQVPRLKLHDQFIQAILGDAFGGRGVGEHQQRAEKQLQNKRRQNTWDDVQTRAGHQRAVWKSEPQLPSGDWPAACCTGTGLRLTSSSIRPVYIHCTIYNIVSCGGYRWKILVPVFPPPADSLRVCAWADSAPLSSFLRDTASPHTCSSLKVQSVVLVRNFD